MISSAVPDWLDAAQCLVEDASRIWHAEGLPALAVMKRYQ